MNLIIDIPKEINLEIQTYFDRNTAVKYLTLSHTCYDWLNNNLEFWQKIFPLVVFPQNKNPLKYLNNNILVYSPQILERIEHFANNLLLGQKATFICLFPHWPKCYFKLELSYENLGDEAALNHELKLQKINEICLITTECSKGHFLYTIKLNEKNDVYSVSAVMPPFMYPITNGLKFYNIIKCALDFKGWNF